MMDSTPVVHSDPDILGGTPVFIGTRVPVKTWIDYLAAGNSLAEFLDHFPSVSREQAASVAGIQQGFDALNAGQTRPIGAFVREMPQKYDISE
jgi:uncharacterized protein (DUF433 family)